MKPVSKNKQTNRKQAKTTETIKGDRACKMLGPDLTRAVLIYAIDWVTQPVLISQFSVQPGNLG